MNDSIDRFLIELHCSYRLLILLVLIYSGALICVCVSDLAFFLRLGVSLLIFYYFILQLQNLVWGSGLRSITSIGYGMENQWYLRLGQGDWVIVELNPTRIITRQLMLLCFTKFFEQRKHYVFLFADSMAASDWLQLQRKLNSL